MTDIDVQGLRVGVMGASVMGAVERGKLSEEDACAAPDRLTFTDEVERLHATDVVKDAPTSWGYVAAGASETAFRATTLAAR